MLAIPRKGKSETFIVWNYSINLVGALILLHKGRASIYETIRFRNGEKLSFSSESSDRKILHQKLMSLCQFVAAYYGTNVIHREDRIADSEIEISGFKIESPLLN